MRSLRLSGIWEADTREEKYSLPRINNKLHNALPRPVLAIVTRRLHSKFQDETPGDHIGWMKQEYSRAKLGY